MRYSTSILLALCLVSGCAPRGFRPPPTDEEAYTSKNNPSAVLVRKAIDECGDSQPLRLIDGESSDNAVARIDECMFRRGFHHANGWGGMCSMRTYRDKLPACVGAHIRSSTGYYGE